MTDVTYDKAELARTAKQEKKEAEARKLESLRTSQQPILQEHTYPRTVVQELGDGLYEIIYIDANTTISRKVESTKNAKQPRNKPKSGAGGDGVSSP